MNLKSPPPTELHQHMLLLLPWYLNQSLEQAEQQQVKKHVAQCLLCRRELVSLRKLSETVTRETDLDVAAEASFAGLRAKLQATPNRLHAVPSVKSSKVNGFGNYSKRFARFPSSTAARFAIAASLLLAMIPLGRQYLSSTMPTDYYTLSIAKPKSLINSQLRVVFSNNLSDAEIDSVLAQINGQRVGGRNTVGALTVTIETGTDLTNAVAFLRNRQDVVLAEPIIHP